MKITAFFRKTAYDHYIKGTQPTALPDAGRRWLLLLLWMTGLMMMVVTAATLSLAHVPFLVRALDVQPLVGHSEACPAPSRRVAVFVATQEGMPLAAGQEVTGQLEGRRAKGRILGPLRPLAAARVTPAAADAAEACVSLAASVSLAGGLEEKLTALNVSVATRPVAVYFRGALRLGDTEVGR